MKPSGHFVGTVSKDAVIRKPEGKKPFIMFGLESFEANAQYPSRVNCMLYGKEIENTVKTIRQGATVYASGEFSANAYLPNGKDKPSASLNMFVKSWHIVLEASSPAPEPERPDVSDIPTGMSAPAAATEVDDVPF